MLKKLDKLILKAFIGPFAATFFITLMVLVMQFFWLWIDDFVGKGLSPALILEFILYQSGTLVPLALPLAVLLSSLMTFGNLGESYELVAVKSSGISLLRFMRPLFVVVLGICGVAFFFGNYVIPVAVLKSRTLLGDIVYAKPAFDLKEGVFYNRMSGVSIKVGQKQNDSILKDIIIYEQSGGLQDNFIVASDGVMRSSADKRYLEFYLKNGWRYQEQAAMGSTATEFIRLGFKEYKKSFDMASFALTRTSDSVNKSNSRVMTMQQLKVAIDSMQKRETGVNARLNKDVFIQTNFTMYLDSNWKAAKPVAAKKFEQLIPDSIETVVHQNAVARAAALKSSNAVFLDIYEAEQKELRRYQIEWHRKISLSLACLVLFIIGAPLGSIIRKGGLGSSMIFAIVFFMLFYFIGNTGEKFAKEGNWNVAAGMWLATIVLTPIGLFLTYKAVNDSQLFNKDYYIRLRQKFGAWQRRKSA